MNPNIWLALILLLNFGVSWLNCWSCGRAWVEAKALGGFPRLLVWCGAIQAAIGFSSVFLFPLIFTAGWAFPEYFTAKMQEAAIQMWYITVILPAISTGFVLTIESWIAFARDHSIANGGTALYNTIVQAHNTWGMVQNLGPAFSSVSKTFTETFFTGDSDDDGKTALARIGFGIALACVLIALLAGILLTRALIIKYSATVALPMAGRRTARA